ncbi:MAG: serine/threonine protein kinase [Magnetococcus sp. YQC-5]
MTGSLDKMPILFQLKTAHTSLIANHDPHAPTRMEHHASAPQYGPGTTVLAGRYLIEKKLAQGSFGAVVAVMDQVTGKPLAMKIAQNAKNMRLLQKEARLLQMLQQGPHILPFHAFEQTDATAFLLTEQLHGGDLMDLVKTKGTLSEIEAFALVHQIGLALAYAHSRIPPILHRDVKPANILSRSIPPHGLEWFLADWGLADTWENPEESNVSGTFGYTAPEVWQQKRYPVSDIYSLGMTLFYALFGRPAYKGNSTEVARAQQAPQPVEIPSATPSSLRILLQGMLAKEPTSRWSLVQVQNHVQNSVGQTKKGGICFNSKTIRKQAVHVVLVQTSRSHGSGAEGSAIE